jgi:tetratricopeptide (TPR) repeat protein
MRHIFSLLKLFMNVSNSADKNLDQDQAKVYQSNADLCLQKGQVDEAIDYYLKTIQVRPMGGIPYARLRHIPLNPQQLDRAIAVYLQAAEQRQNYHEPNLSLAHAMTAKGDVSEACCFYRKAAYFLNLGRNRKWVEQHWKNPNQEVGGKPNFIIIGSEKCGTSSLHYYITRHPQVLDAAQKEIHFFTQNQKYNQGKDWYFSHFPPISDNSGFMVGEGSTSYISCLNNAPQRVLEMLPEVKLLAVLRNPVDRAVSNYHQLVKLGKERRSLEEVMMTEMELFQEVDNFLSLSQKYRQIDKGCIRKSLYAYFLEQWMSFFQKEQFLILQSEDLFKHPEAVMEQVFEFLGLPNFLASNYEAVNTGGSYSHPEGSLEGSMADFFRPHNQKLEALLGKVFNW